MDQKIVSRSGVIVSKLCMMLGIILIPASILVLASYPEMVWPLGIVLFICGIVIFREGLRFSRKSSAEYKSTNAQIMQIHAMTAAQRNAIPVKDHEKKFFAESFSSGTAEQVLASWVYTEEEWRRFCRWKKKKLKRGSIRVGLFITVLSVLLLKFARDFSWMAAIAVGVLIAFIYVLISYLVSIASAGKAYGQQNVVIITNRAALINNRLNFFADKERSVKEVKIAEEMDPKILSIICCRSTESGREDDEIHIPIPKGRLGEAVLLMEHLKNRGNGVV